MHYWDTKTQPKFLLVVTNSRRIWKSSGCRFCIVVPIARNWFPANSEKLFIHILDLTSWSYPLGPLQWRIEIVNISLDCHHGVLQGANIFPHKIVWFIPMEPFDFEPQRPFSKILLVDDPWLFCLTILFTTCSCSSDSLHLQLPSFSTVFQDRDLELVTSDDFRKLW